MNENIRNVDINYYSVIIDVKLCSNAANPRRLPLISLDRKGASSNMEPIHQGIKIYGIKSWYKAAGLGGKTVI